MKVEYIDVDEKQVAASGMLPGFTAIVTGLAPNEPIFAFRARDIAFPVAFAAWWAEVAEHLTSERGAEAKASAARLATWAEQNPEQARLPD